jgi:glycosyltransferase involved in cell wall biosynthesis
VWIHGLWSSTTFFTAKYSIRQKIPYVLTPHGMLEYDALRRKAFKKKIYWLLIERKIFINASLIHCINEAEEVQVSRYSKTATCVMANGIEIHKFKVKKYQKLNSICFIGRLHEKKGLDLLIKSLKTIDDINLIVAGTGEVDYVDYLNNLVVSLNLQNRVSFMGFADEPMKKEIFSKSLFIVIPSYTEVLTFVALESISESTPVLITKQCNFPKILTAEAGFIMINNSPAIIKQGIQKMLDSDISKMSINAHILAEQYGIKTQASMLQTKLIEVSKCTY